MDVYLACHKTCRPTELEKAAAWVHLKCTDEADLKDTLATTDELHANGHLFEDVFPACLFSMKICTWLDMAILFLARTVLGGCFQPCVAELGQ